MSMCNQTRNEEHLNSLVSQAYNQAFLAIRRHRTHYEVSSLRFSRCVSKEPTGRIAAIYKLTGHNPSCVHSPSCAQDAEVLWSLTDVLPNNGRGQSDDDCKSLLATYELPWNSEVDLYHPIESFEGNRLPACII
jgi:hypothetical protein